MNRSGEAFLRLWPVHVLCRELPAFEVANREIYRVLVDLDRRRDPSPTDPLSVDNPAIRWLDENIRRCLDDYAAELGTAGRMEWTLRGVNVLQRFGEHRLQRARWHADLRGMYFVQVPRAGDAAVTPGRVTFLDPHPTVTMSARPDPDAGHTLTGRPGLLLVWPAFVHRLVHPNLSRDLQASIEFDVLARPADDDEAKASPET